MTQVSATVSRLHKMPEGPDFWTCATTAMQLNSASLWLRNIMALLKAWIVAGNRCADVFLNHKIPQDFLWMLLLAVPSAVLQPFASCPPRAFATQTFQVHRHNGVQATHLTDHELAGSAQRLTECILTPGLLGLKLVIRCNKSTQCICTCGGQAPGCEDNLQKHNAARACCCEPISTHHGLYDPQCPSLRKSKHHINQKCNEIHVLASRIGAMSST